MKCNANKIYCLKGDSESLNTATFSSLYFINSSVTDSMAADRWVKHAVERRRGRDVFDDF